MYYKKDNIVIKEENGKFKQLNGLDYAVLNSIPDGFLLCPEKYWKQAENTFFREKRFEWEYNGEKYYTQKPDEDFKMKLNQHFYNNDYKKLPIKIFYKGKVWDFLGAVSDPGSGGALLERVVGGKTYSCIANIKNFKEIVNSN